MLFWAILYVFKIKGMVDLTFISQAQEMLPWSNIFSLELKTELIQYSWINET